MFSFQEVYDAVCIIISYIKSTGDYEDYLKELEKLQAEMYRDSSDGYE